MELRNGHRSLAHASEKRRLQFERMSLGDMVKVQMSPYDLMRGCITHLDECFEKLIDCFCSRGSNIDAARVPTLIHLQLRRRIAQAVVKIVVGQRTPAAQ